ncbi:peptidase M23 [Micromonospora sp. LH3U1]|uniref:peptidase M23 n=1 Tax=Micromonospora sp. LH3U1 TaxID=3018339 RepID=UPI00234995A3|nr:peptidase M23 [Micromonospora sp. LH3U1]WCN79499.1 peptidase M23 [Micromonospora sp. LH3U1]
MISTRRWLGRATTILLVATLASTVSSGAHAAPASDVTTAVRHKLLEEAAVAADQGIRTAGLADTRVTVTRRDSRAWAFGTAVLVAPQEEGLYPSGWIFVARQQRGGWQVAFEGEANFAELAAAAPASVVAQRERDAFTAPITTAANGDFRTGMRLPFALGQSWTLRGGPHGWSGSPRPFSSIDLFGGDERVLTTRAGTAYTMCKGWIRVIHDRGYATDYYHLWNNINVDGTSVGAGAYLGNTGTDITCGGSASSRHVHLGFRQNSAYVAIATHNLGKWVPREGSTAYEGSALHGSKRVNVGGALYNYGALGFTEGIIDSNGGTSVSRRSGPGTGYGVVGSIADGATAAVACSANGTTHTGRWGTTALWNRLTDGTWIPDAYHYTGAASQVNGWC